MCVFHQDALQKIVAAPGTVSQIEETFRQEIDAAAHSALSAELRSHALSSKLVVATDKSMFFQDRRKG